MSQKAIDKNCVACKSPFHVSAEDLHFLQKISPTIGKQSFPIPAPSHCPTCRLQRRLSYRNEYCYYSRKCDLCSKSIVSIHAPENPYPVYCHSCWWGESWDPHSFGSTFDHTKSFFEQFHNLQQQVPQLAMMNDNGVNSENCEYCQDFAFGKNCYLVTASWEVQDCGYSTQSNRNKQVFDCYLVNESELSYECSLGHKLYSCSELMLCSGCTDCHYGIDLRECSNCIASIGLRQKQYCIFNKQLSESDYFEQVKLLNLSSRSGRQQLQKRFKEFSSSFPRKAVHQLNCENCQGDSLSHCRNFQGYGVIRGEDSKYIWQGDHPVNCYDLQVTGNSQWCYEGATVDNSYMTHFSTWTWHDKYLLYSDNCHSSEHLFGCIALKKKSYCILNKQYSKSEYEQLITNIFNQMMDAGEWGEFPPIQYSPFAYNETRAQDIFPIDKTQAAKLALRWKEEDRKSYKPASTILPDDITEVQNSILQALLACSKCQKNYKINKIEFGLYKDCKLPIPDCCPDCRRNARFKRYPSTGFLYASNCKKCKAELDSVYSPESYLTILCDKCYNKETY